VSAKIDFKKEIEAYRARTGRFDLVEVPPLQYLMIDGHGDPNTSAEFTAAVEALYPIAYGLKFTSKRDLGHDYTVMPLEGLWWADHQASFTSSRDKSAWHWRLMIMQPEWIDHEMFADAVERASAKNPGVGGVRLETLDEGLCAQTLHVGSYDDEAPVLARLHDEVIPGLGLRMTGRHHEIYLSDPRRTAPERLRTILRQPVG